LKVVYVAGPYRADIICIVERKNIAEEVAQAIGVVL
jgi:hypothetical protein